MRLFDSHCHLGSITEATEEVLARAAAAGVDRVLTVGIDAASSAQAIGFARRFPGVLGSAGLHPNSADRLADEWPQIRELGADDACAAIGETGCDHYWKDTTPEQQREAFVAHLTLAAELDKPVIVHVRDAFPEMLETLREFTGLRGVIHCFSEGPDEAREALDLGFYLSFSGSITYKRADAVRAAAQLVPDDRILVETDAPFLAPQARRGTANEPAFLVHTLEEIARVRDVPAATLATQTTRNAIALFGQ